MRVIGLSGFAGCGKSTVADYLVRQYGFRRLSFGAAVKDVVSVVFGWPREWLEGNTPETREWRETPDAFWSKKFHRPFTPRYAMQYIGTDVFRNVVHPDIWANLVLSRIHSEQHNTVIDDVRFCNERRVLREISTEFLIVHRLRFPSLEHRLLWNHAMHGLPCEQTISLHPSEWDWLQDPEIHNDTVIVNSGSYDELHTAIDMWYTTGVVPLFS